MLLSDKELKKKFKLKAQQNPRENYPVITLKELGFERKQCKNCKTYFWTVNSNQEVCGDSMCSGGYTFFENPPVKKKLDYIEVWKEFSKHFKKMGYTPIKRYPVVARWNPTTDYTIASIAAFQPYVVTGEVKPPANPLVVPQFCLRFNDIDNVGITGSHYTGFVMIGQHAFMPPEEYDINKYLKEIYSWLNKGLGLPKNEITFHEDAWAGGGNFGPSMEFFSRGLELGNQVYMQYEQLPSGGKNELNIKVLDMGMGHERNAWFTSGKATSYESTFPTVVKKLHKITGVGYDKDLMNKFLPYAALLNVDEVSNIEKVWKKISKEINVDLKLLKTKITKLASLYSIADHTRSLLFAISDGALPSNIGGAYNLRIILRRALSFIDKYKWDIDINNIVKEHANYLKPLFPELSQNLNEVNEILDFETMKYEKTKKTSKKIVQNIVKKNISENKLLELYDSKGITPEMIKEEALKQNKEIDVPKNFYAKIAERHENVKKEKNRDNDVNINLNDIPSTEALYFEDYTKTKFSAKILKAESNYIILDKTYFYPTSGGQLHDVGIIQNGEVVDVVKKGNVIVHVMKKEVDSALEGQVVDCVVNMDWRKQLAQHHTATHIVNVAARKILGKHINQAGAKKTKEKAHIDLTHFKSISDEELKEIEKEANKIINEKIPITSKFMERNKAEKKYGMRIYQGGAVPGKDLRIVAISNIDVECCGGTHLKNTGEVEEIKILKSAKISDGVVRLTFVAGGVANKEKKKEEDILQKAAELLEIDIEKLPARAEELFEKWKKAKKALKKKKIINKKEFLLNTNIKEKLSNEELLKKIANVLKTQPEHILKTLQRFKKELDEILEK